MKEHKAITCGPAKDLRLNAAVTQETTEQTFCVMGWTTTCARRLAPLGQR